MVYRNYGSERPQLVGGKPIKGFAQYKDHILVADLAAQGLKGVAFKQDLFDGKRQILARYPTAVPAFSAALIAFKEVIPELPSCAGHSLGLSTSTGMTCHQIALTLMS